MITALKKLARSLRLNSKRGFSLAEVSLSLVIATVSLVAILGLIPVGIQTNSTTLKETDAMFVLSGIIADYKGSTITTSNPGYNTGNTNMYNLPLPFTRVNDDSVATIIVTEGDEETFYLDDNPTLNTTAATTFSPGDLYLLTVRWVRVPQDGGSTAPNAGIENLAPVEAVVTLSWPAQVSLANAQGRVDAYMTMPWPIPGETY